MLGLRRIKIPARIGIALGLTALVASVLLAAVAAGLVPSERTANVQGRAALCESIAVGTSVCATRGDMPGLEAVLKGTVTRNKDILSAGVRDAAGALIVEVGDHRAHWESPKSGAAVDSYVYVPIHANNAKWGAVEVRFTPLTRGGVLGLLLQPSVRLALFIPAACAVLFLFYLKRVLQHLDPSKVVPKRVRSALDTLAEGLLVVDNDERIVLANQALADAVGRPPEELVGTRASHLPWVGADGEPLAGTGAKAAAGAAGEIPWVVAARESKPQRNAMLRLPDGKGGRRTFSVNCSPVLGQDGKYRGVLASFDDVTRLEAQEAEVRKSRDAAEAANRAKSEFLARMSHEIRTPMNAILGFADVLRRGFEESEAERQEYLNTIHSSGRHLLELINDILDLSKIESGRLEVERTECSPHRLITEVVTVLGVRAREKGVALEYSWDGGLPETILSDPTRFRQALTNLVGNAIKFTENGSVRVVARLQPAGAGNASAKLAIDVIDTGVGIQPEAIERIFKPFAQADTSVTRRFGGTGLGLAISRQLAEAMGGGLSVRSKFGQGSVFTLSIDPGSLAGVRVLEAMPTDRRAVVSSGQAGGPAATTGLRRLPNARVLLVEDGVSNQKLVRLVLERAGATVETADNGQIAIDKATWGSYDVILMDMQMPVVDGYTATTTLRGQGLTVPIIALTAHAMKGEEEKCRAAGCSGFLTKPIDMDLLVNTVADVLTGRGDGGSVARTAPPVQDAQSDQAPRPIAEGLDFGAAAAPAGRPPLMSSLPTDDPEFCEVVVEFIGRLGQQLTAMQSAWEQGELDQLARLAHWVKGSGGTAGFAALTAPAARLERLAKDFQLDDIAASIAELRDLSSRMVVPPSPAAAADPLDNAGGPVRRG